MNDKAERCRKALADAHRTFSEMMKEAEEHLNACAEAATDGEWLTYWKAYDKGMEFMHTKLVEQSNRISAIGNDIRKFDPEGWREEMEDSGVVAYQNAKKESDQPLGLAELLALVGASAVGLFLFSACANSHPSEAVVPEHARDPRCHVDAPGIREACLRRNATALPRLRDDLPRRPPTLDDALKVPFALLRARCWDCAVRTVVDNGCDDGLAAVADLYLCPVWQATHCNTHVVGSNATLQGWRNTAAPLVPWGTEDRSHARLWRRPGC